MVVVQELTQQDWINRFFSDEAHFHISGCVNSHHLQDILFKTM
jgi:hypothetical protein